MNTTFAVLKNLESNEKISTLDLGIEDPNLHGILLSLSSKNIIEFEIKDHMIHTLSDEGIHTVDNGSHEYNFHSSIPEGGIPVGDNSNPIGRSQAFNNRWIKIQNDMIYKKEENILDTVRNQLQSLNILTVQELSNLKKRNLITSKRSNYYIISRGPQFGKSTEDLQINITSEDIINNTTLNLKPFNFNTVGNFPEFGNFHPLNKMRTEIKNVFIEMGFSEMSTDHYVETSFWNFDSLFQPQDHPSRDSHDTFFVDSKKKIEVPLDYFRRVKEIHEKGGFGSTGHGNNWKEAEAHKLILRTHTTAESARKLYEISQNEFKPMKLFSVDRVFRNESVDATHLAEFHQVEGLIIAKDLKISHLMGILEEFFKKLNMPQIRFKPAFNPYTEPSMEVFAYHEGLDRWMEVGNSGIFRPEMLRPMGFDEDVRVIAWGLSLERPAMIKYKLNNIRELLGHKVDFEFIKNTGLCSFD